MAMRKPARENESALQAYVNKAFRKAAKSRRLLLESDGGLPAIDYYVQLFRQCWNAAGPTQRDTANLTLDAILTEDPHNPQRVSALKALGKETYPTDQMPRPVFSVDLTGAGFRRQPRDYFDVLALTLIHARRRLGICSAEGCLQHYFISKYPRQHYCSDRCLAEGRRASKRKWAKFHYKAAKPEEFGVRGKAPRIWADGSKNI